MSEQRESDLDQFLPEAPQCPHCSSEIVRRSRRRNFRDRMMSIVSRLPYRCEECDLRFYGSPVETRIA
jgi:ribosomal protein L37AE/L43A